jgi:hypothetical protein
MNPIGVKDQIQFAHVFEALVQGLDKDLDEIEDAQIGFLRVDGKYKIKGSVVPINELDVFAPFRNGSLEVVAETVGPGCHLREDPPYDALLELFRFDGLIEFDQSWFPVVVDDYYSLDHDSILFAILAVADIRCSCLFVLLGYLLATERRRRWMQRCNN